MGIEVRVEIPEGLDAAQVILQEEVVTAIQNSGLSMEREAKNQAPVDTGHLRRSITSQTVSLGSQPQAIVSAPVKYAPYVEFGTGIYARDGNGRKTPWVYRNRRGQFIRTHGNKPNPFMGRSFEIKKDATVSRVSDAIRRAIERMKK